MADILLVDDHQNARKVVSIILTGAGFNVVEAQNGQLALNKLKKQNFDLVITDMKMTPVDGIELLKETKQSYKNTEVIMMTGYGTIQNSVKAMKLGAYDFITKPVNKDELLFLVKSAMERRINTFDGNGVDQGVKIIGASGPMKNVLTIIIKVARTDSTVLITGESGTGKELVAKAIHEKSPRQNKPMIIINCGSLPESLMESELFGHVKGAFTGAVREKAGLFQEADGGTLFLDEVGELTLATQVKLLRFLQEGEIRPVGHNQSIKVDVRIIAATNRDLEQEVHNSNFREDLYYRLNVIPFKLPSLRERKDDIPLLLEHFLFKYAKKFCMDTPQISPPAMALLTNYHWPGNVRELENIVERILALTGKPVIEPKDLPVNFVKNCHDFVNINDLNGIQSLADMERSAILGTLKNCGNNHKLTAQTLGIATTTLWRKMKRYQIEIK